jgi:flagellar basal-body rod protein FlgG
MDISGGNVAANSPAEDTGSYKALAPEKRMIRLADSPINVTEDGGVYQNGARMATVSVEEFHENQWLEKSGNSYFRNTNPDNIKYGDTSTKVVQGFIEGSNVNPVKEMAKLIEVTRAYESHMQAIKTYQDIDSRTVNQIAGR